MVKLSLKLNGFSSMKKCQNCKYALKPVIRRHEVGCGLAYLDEDHESKLVLSGVISDNAYVYDRNPEEGGKGVMFIAPMVSSMSSCYLFEENVNV